jgi:AraC-like DNA-binding protein
MSVFLGLPTISRLRDAIFRGAMVEALDIRAYDRDIFLRWREELHEGDQAAADIVKDELTARIRRLDREGWQDLRNLAVTQADSKGHDAARLIPVERMARFIGEHAVEDISVEDVAAAANLHPNYAMGLFKNSVGITINQSIIRHRLDVAQSLLIASDRSVAEIAFESGFGSLSSFYAAFEQRFAASPASFRRRFKAQTVQR